MGVYLKHEKKNTWMGNCLFTHKILLLVPPLKKQNKNKQKNTVLKNVKNLGC